MNISNWPFDKIMSLPDYVFGRRFLISCMLYQPTEGTFWDISEIAFPETAVIWELHLYVSGSPGLAEGMRIALGDQVPTGVPQMDSLEPVFNGLGLQGAGPRLIPTGKYRSFEMRRLKLPVRTSGRRLVVEFSYSGTGPVFCDVMLTVSGVPREIPDCLV